MKVVKWGVHGTGTCTGPGILLNQRYQSAVMTPIVARPSCVPYTLFTAQLYSLITFHASFSKTLSHIADHCAIHFVEHGRELISYILLMCKARSALHSMISSTSKPRLRSDLVFRGPSSHVQGLVGKGCYYTTQ